ncbi:MULTISPECIES: Fe-Mn family superoxide dismutase [unclassified Clostridium]|uniref:superoxide dismutase n=1 Tax=unclassified Clostridium TaxID=2614128 RepID=UPI00110691B3|nr:MULTISPECIES: Fe-Mn family superoxide dismutase [unclassified Clostridium]
MPRTYPFAPQMLPYPCYGLTPGLQADGVYLHHSVLYSGDIAALNALLSQYPDAQGLTLSALLTDPLPTVRTVDRARIRHLAGSLFSHELYFAGLCPQGADAPQGALRAAILARYGSLEAFKALVRQAAGDILGVGFVWLNTDAAGNIHLAITNDYRTPQLNLFTPVLVLDAWEHAYFSPYYTGLDAYVESWFSLLNWREAERRYNAATALGRPPGGS